MKRKAYISERDTAAAVSFCVGESGGEQSKGWAGGHMFTEGQKKTGEWVRKVTAASYRGWKAFYHTTAWKKKRKQILARDHNSCQRCRQNGRYRRAATVHHIKHLKDVPELALEDSNLLSLCGECHEEMHPEKHRKRAGYKNEERW